MLGIPYAVPDGFFNAWISVLDVNLKPLDVSQDTAGKGSFTPVERDTVNTRFLTDLNVMLAYKEYRLSAVD